jgi:Raf kinase inhibitor-like YbhB/YbcL family protein
MKRIILVIGLLLGALNLAHAESNFRLLSYDIKEGKEINEKHQHNQYGCSGLNISPALKWEGAPQHTKSFAVTLFDPDATSGSGWWHWITYDIPASFKGLPSNAGSTLRLPEGIKLGTTDFGTKEFAGACPPTGKMHRYEFTVYALKVKHLNLPDSVSAAMIGFMIRENAIAEAKITAVVIR